MQYYYLVSSLPELGGESFPLKPTVLREHIEANLTPADCVQFRYLLYRNDNKNLLRLMRAYQGVADEAHLTFDEPAVFTHPQLEEGFEGWEGLPPYMAEFVDACRRDRLPNNGRARENALIRRYYEAAQALPDPFLRSHFAFKRDLKNIISALNARRYGYPLDDVMVGTGETVDALTTRSSADFGLAASHPYIGEVAAAVAAEEFVALERLVDRLLVEHVDGHTEGDRFGAAQVYGYFIKYAIGYRWALLEHDETTAELQRITERVLSRATWPEDFADHASAARRAS